MAAKLLSLYLLAALGLGVVNACTPSYFFFSPNDALTTSRVVPLQTRQSNQNSTCAASEKKLSSDLQQMGDMLNQLSAQMQGSVRPLNLPPVLCGLLTRHQSEQHGQS